MKPKKELTVEVWYRRLHDIDVKHFHEREISGKDLYNYDEVILGEVMFSRVWRESGMQVYDFDKEFAESVMNESLLEVLPDVIRNAPHESFYMKLPSNELNEGVLVTISSREELLVPPHIDIPDKPTGEVMPLFGSDLATVVVSDGREFYINGFAVSKTMDLMDDDTPIEAYKRELMLNGLAYLCTINADIVPSYKPTTTRRNPAKKRSMATWSDVGYRIGAELRAYERARSLGAPHQGGTVRPHMRRAHWHRFWTGPKDGERNLELRWLAPIMVNAGEQITSPTGHRVRKA